MIFILFLPRILAGHEGGHYHSGDLFKVWKLKNGKTIEGNFNRGNENELILEQKDGKVFKLPLSILQKNDLKIAKIKIQKYLQIHSNSLEYTHPKISQPISIDLFMVVGCLFIFILIFTNYKKQYISYNMVYGLFLIVLIIYACKTDPGLSQISSSSSSVITPPKTSISYLDSAFYPYKKTVSTSNDGTYYYVNSNGIPEHNMMVGITSWQQQVPIQQNYIGSNHWSIPLKPVYESSPLSTKSNFMKGAVAIAVNGIPIFNALNNRGEDSFVIGELDQWGGHCGRADD